MTDLSIVLVNFKMKEAMLQAVQSVVEDCLLTNYQIEITVVDNSANIDGLKEALGHTFPQVNYLDAGSNTGFGKGHVTGFQAHAARYYFALNPDTIIPPKTNVVSRIVEYMDQHPLVGVMGPKLLYPDGRLQYSTFRFDFFSILIKPLKHLHAEEKIPFLKKFIDRLQMADFNHESTRAVDWVLGAAMIVRSDAIEDVGWFDERYFMYLEDCDWCHTMWENNWPVHYVHDIEIIHTHERASAKIPGLRAVIVNRVARIHLVSWIKYLLKWLGKHKSYAGE